LEEERIGTEERDHVSGGPFKEGLRGENPSGLSGELLEKPSVKKSGNLSSESDLWGKSEEKPNRNSREKKKI